MNTKEILATLNKTGKPQTAAIYKRHGSGDNVFGTLTSEIGKLSKKIKVDNALAAELWKTGNAEARVLALQLTDPSRLTRAGADELLDDGPAHFLFCYLSELVALSPVAESTMRVWMKSKEEIHGSANYARYAMNGLVIAIGVFKPSLRDRAIAAARRIGKVEVDHGETTCKTPDAASYIEKAGKRKRCP